MSRISRWRCAVWYGGSKLGIWSLNGSSLRQATMTSVMSLPAIGCENFTNGPLTVLQDE